MTEWIWKVVQGTVSICKLPHWNLSPGTPKWPKFQSLTRSKVKLGQVIPISIMEPQKVRDWDQGIPGYPDDPCKSTVQPLYSQDLIVRSLFIIHLGCQKSWKFDVFSPGQVNPFPNTATCVWGYSFASTQQLSCFLLLWCHQGPGWEGRSNVAECRCWWRFSGTVLHDSYEVSVGLPEATRSESLGIAVVVASLQALTDWRVCCCRDGNWYASVGESCCSLCVAVAG